MCSMVSNGSDGKIRERQQCGPDLVDADNSISDVVQSDLTVPINVQNVKGPLRLLRLQEVLQILRQNIRPACESGLCCSVRRHASPSGPTFLFL